MFEISVMNVFLYREFNGLFLLLGINCGRDSAMENELVSRIYTSGKRDHNYGRCRGY